MINHGDALCMNLFELKHQKIHKLIVRFLVVKLTAIKIDRLKYFIDLI